MKRNSFFLTRALMPLSLARAPGSIPRFVRVSVRPSVINEKIAMCIMTMMNIEFSCCHDGDANAGEYQFGMLG